jgi:hypothetical protein
MEPWSGLFGLVGVLTGVVAIFRARTEANRTQVDMWKSMQETMLKNFVELKSKDIERERRINELRDLIESLRGELSEARHLNAVLQIKYDDLKSDSDAREALGVEKDKRLNVMGEELASLYEQISHSRSLSHIRRNKS